MELRKRDRVRRPFTSLKARLKSREDDKGEEAVACLLIAFLTLVFYVVAGWR